MIAPSVCRPVIATNITRSRPSGASARLAVRPSARPQSERSFAARRSDYFFLPFFAAVFFAVFFAAFFADFFALVFDFLAAMAVVPFFAFAYIFGVALEPAIGGCPRVPRELLFVGVAGPERAATPLPKPPLLRREGKDV